jgi:spore coat polysaccharide biosynthesis protein SpsF (cytidylyltransferase family)
VDQKIVAIIQARMGSTRLPGKVLADIAGEPALGQMIRRVKRSTKITELVVATSVKDRDDPIADLCKQYDTPVYRGDEWDVLGRFVGAAKSMSAAVVVRLTADCPMIDPEIIDCVVGAFQAVACDYASNCNVRTFPDGLDVEVFTIGALIEADQCATEEFSREHVTPYIRGIHANVVSGSFHRYDFTFGADFSHLRWTVDTADDLRRVRALYRLLPAQFNWLDALSCVTKNPDLLS